MATPDVEAEIAKFFQVLDAKPPADFRFSDADIRRLSSLLSTLPGSKPSWTRVPRLYLILRLIDRVALLDQFIQNGFSDYLFPVNANGLPNCLDAPSRLQFVQIQHIVCTKAVDLEKGSHQVFAADQSEELFVVNKILGTSTSAQVDHVTSNLSFEEYARKRIVRRTTGSKRVNDTASNFIGELEILKRLKHEHIIAIHGSYTDPKYFALLLTPVAECNLAEYFGRVLERPELKVTLRTFFGCLATAVTYLHQNLVKHKDIKPQNILVHRGSALLTDFGISRLSEDTAGVTTEGWTMKTPRYCAPEVSAYDKRGNSSDVWSLGCVFLEMTTTLKGHPVEHMNEFLSAHGSHETNLSANEEAVDQWTKGLESQASKIDNRPLQWIKAMLQRDRDSRPSARDIIRLIYDQHVDGPYIYGGLCCNYDMEDADLFTSQPTASLRNDLDKDYHQPPTQHLHRLEASERPDPAPAEGILPLVEDDSTRHNIAFAPIPERSTVLPSDERGKSIKDSEQTSTVIVAPDDLHSTRQDAVMHERLLSSIYSAANAASMRIYKSALRKGGREFASKVAECVHDGGDFRADALFKALDKDDIQVLEFLLNSGLDANTTLWQGSTPVTPLEAAVRKYNQDRNANGMGIALLLDHGGKLECIERAEMFRCFKNACGAGAFYLVDKLLNAGFKIQDFDEDQDSHALLRAACKAEWQQEVKIVTLLLQHGVRPWPKYDGSESALQSVIEDLDRSIKTKYIYSGLRKPRLDMLLAMLRATILPRTQSQRHSVMSISMLFNALEIPTILAEKGEPMTAAEAAWCLQQWVFHCSDVWPKSTLYWHKTFLKHGLEPLGKIELLPEFQPDDSEDRDHLLLLMPQSPLEQYLINVADSDDKPDGDEWKQLITESLARAKKSSKQEKIECWPFVDIMIKFALSDEPIAHDEDGSLSDFFRYFLRACDGLSIPNAVLRNEHYSIFCGSELVAAIMLGADCAVKVLLETDIDVNKLIFDQSVDRYRSPLNFALNLPDLGALKRDKDLDEKIVNRLKEKGARDFTKAPGFTKRLSKSWKRKS